MSSSPPSGNISDRPGYGKSRHRERAELLGYQLTGREGGGSFGRWTPTEFMSNSRGVVHGGLVGTVIDDVAAIAIFAADPAVVSSATVTMHIDFLLPLLLGVEYTCTGEVLRMGGRFAVADVRVNDADGKLCLHGTATFAVTRATAADGGRN